MIKESDIWRQNPWWRDPKNISSDDKVLEWEKSTTRYTPRMMHKIEYDFHPDDTVVYTLRGSRQVGKTTLIKLQIKKFLESGVSPWNILYCSLDLAGSKQDVVDVVEAYMNLSARQRDGRRYYLFLDEASSVDEWQVGIKRLADAGRLKNCTVMATGSQAINMKNSIERLPNRSGMVDDSHDKILRPIKFSEYACMLDDNIRKAVSDLRLLKPDTRREMLSGLLKQDIYDGIDRLNAHQNELNHMLDGYMLTGGTPYVINERASKGVISQNTYAMYLDGIIGEWGRLSKSDALLKQFVGATIKSMSSHISWSGLAKNAALGSSNTAMEYAHTLKNLFILSIVHHFGTHGKTPMFQKNRKLYFADPFFLHVFNNWINEGDAFEASLRYVESDEGQGKVVEGIVADHLIRLASGLNEEKRIFDHSHHVFHWKSGSNREVDFILANVNGIEAPIEVRPGRKINHRKLSGLAGFLNESGSDSGGLVLSRSSLEARTDYVVVPTSIFLLLA